MRKRETNSTSREEIIREISRLISAWEEYIKRLFFYNLKVRSFLTSTSIVFFISCFTIGLVLWVKNSLYAQTTEMAAKQTAAFAIPGAFPLIMSGGLVSVFIGFARAKYQIFKRCFDVFTASLSLLVLSPLFLIIAVLVKIDSEGPVFFKQKRLGRKGKIFEMWKFRTMRKNAELETGPVWAEDGDPRVTKFGQFLRNSHLDELPQLFNMFKGEMSLIGPRPERRELIKMIDKRIPSFHQRLDITPGITGLAQVRYQYGASVKDATRKLKYDLLYIKKMCWILDFQIILWTAGRVLSGEGAR